MASRELVDYINERRKEGYSDDRIRTVLQVAGYSAGDIDDALRGSHIPATPAPPPPPAAAPVGGIIPPASSTPSSMAPAPSASAQPMNAAIPASAPGAAAAAVAASERRDARFPKIAILLGVAGVLLFGGAAFAYVQFVGSGPNPQTVIENALEKNFSGLHSMRVVEDGDITVFYSNPHTSTSSLGMAELLLGSSSTFKLTGHFDGMFDVADKAHPKFDEVVTISIMSPDRGLSWKLGGEIRVIDKKGYFKIDDVPNVGLFDASAFKGKWISADLPTSTTQGLVRPSSTSFTLSDADARAILDALKKAYKVTKRFPVTDAGGVPSYHYAFAIDQRGITDLISALIAVGHQSSSTNELVQREVGYFVAGLSDMGGEIWVGKDDGFTHEVSGHLTYATSTPQYNIRAVVTGSSTMSNINEPVTIEVPAGAEDLASVMASVMASPSFAVGSLSSPASRDARRLADLRIVQSELELYFNKCGFYPGAAGAGMQSASCGKHAAVSTWDGVGGGLVAALELAYIGVNAVPADPNIAKGGTYYFGTNADGSHYIIAAKLEEASNSIFKNYTPPSLTGFKVTGLSSCKAPYYCLKL